MICALLLSTLTGVEEGVRINHRNWYGLFERVRPYQDKARAVWTSVKPTVIEVAKNAAVASSAYAAYSLYQWSQGPADEDEAHSYGLALLATTSASKALASAVGGLLTLGQLGSKPALLPSHISANTLGALWPFITLPCLKGVDGSTLTWTQLSPTGTLPAARRYNTVSVVGTDVFIFGGFTDSYLNDPPWLLPL